MIKKIMLGLMLLSTLSFGSEYKYYQCQCFELCAKKLNELKREYKILNYTIVYSRAFYKFNMIIEVEKLGKNNGGLKNEKSI